MSVGVPAIGLLAQFHSVGSADSWGEQEAKRVAKEAGAASIVWERVRPEK